MDTTQLLKGVLDLTVLAVVDDEDGYGYDIVRRLRDRRLDDVGDASVYGTLRRLYAGGALTSYVVASETGPHGSTTGSRPRAHPAQAAARRLDVVLHHCHEDPRRSQRMNSILTTPEIRLYVRAVRERLEDLTEEEREELVGGLDADLNDLVEERGIDALPDPASTPASSGPRPGSNPRCGPSAPAAVAGRR